MEKIGGRKASKRQMAVEMYGRGAVESLEAHAIKEAADDFMSGHPRRFPADDDTVWGIAYNECYSTFEFGKMVTGG